MFYSYQLNPNNILKAIVRATNVIPDALINSLTPINNLEVGMTYDPLLQVFYKVDSLGVKISGSDVSVSAYIE